MHKQNDLSPKENGYAAESPFFHFTLLLWAFTFVFFGGIGCGWILCSVY